MSNVLIVMILKSLSQKKKITITFGYNKENIELYGLMMYHKNRLIKAYVHVPCQRKVRTCLMLSALYLFKHLYIRTESRREQVKQTNTDEMI